MLYLNSVRPSLNLILLTGPVVARVVELPLSVTVQDGGGDVDRGKAAVKLGQEVKLRDVRDLVAIPGDPRSNRNRSPGRRSGCSRHPWSENSDISLLSTLSPHLTDTLGCVEVAVRVTPQLTSQVLSVRVGHTLSVSFRVPSHALLAFPLELHRHITAELSEGLGLPGTAAGHAIHGRDVCLQTKDWCPILLRDAPTDPRPCALYGSPVSLTVTLGPPHVHPKLAGLEGEVILGLLVKTGGPRHLDTDRHSVCHLAGQTRAADPLQYC